MTRLLVKSVSIEVEYEDRAGTIVLRDPLGAESSAYVAGELPIAVAEDALVALGLGAPELLAAGGLTRQAVRSAPSRPSILRAADAPLSRPSPPLSPHSKRANVPALADLLDELTQAILRTGRQNPTTTVDELMQDAWLAAGNHAPLSRILARLDSGLSPDAPPTEAALALAALDDFAQRLRDPADPFHLELLGRAPSRALPPCELLELGRRCERGAVGTETRLIVDLSSGELMTEAQARGGAHLSRGPVGRHLSVSFGRRVSSGGSARIEIQHYEYDPAPTVEQLERVSNLASSGVTATAGNGLSLVALPEPVLLQLQSVDALRKTVTCLNGHRLDLADGCCPGVTSALLDLAARGDRIDVLLGTLEILPRNDGQSGLSLVPWSAIAQGVGSRHLVPLSF